MPTASLADIVSHQPPPTSGTASLADIAQVHDAAPPRTGANALLFKALAPVRAWGDAGPHRVHEGLNEVASGQFSKGASDVINGSLVTAAPMLAPRLLGSLVTAPLVTMAGAAATTGAGVAANYAGHAGARAVGASEDQANLAGDVAGLGAGAAAVKLAVPALARWSVTNRALAMGKNYIQATRDIQAALKVNAEDVHRARPFLEAVHNTTIPIVGKEANGGAADQFVKAANAAVEEIEQHIGSLVRQFPNATTPAVDKAIEMRIFKMRGSRVSDLAAARQVIAENGLDQPLSLADAEGIRVRLNAENKAILESGARQRTAVLTNPAYVARQEAANQLREGIYGALEQRGVQGIRDLRLSEGSIIKLRNAADPSTRGLASESTVARTGSTSLMRRVGQKALTLTGAASGASLAGPFGAAAGAEIGSELGSGLTSKNLSKNALLERAFRQTFTSPPVMSVQGIPQSTAMRPRTMRLPSGQRPALMPGQLPPGE